MEKNISPLRQRLLQADPELFMRLQDEGRLNEYLESFFIVPGDPVTALSETLYPSRFDYLAEILQEEFLDTYLLFESSGILTYELINLSAACAADFEGFRFINDTDSRMLRYAVIGTIAVYLEGSDHGL